MSFRFTTSMSPLCRSPAASLGGRGRLRSRRVRHQRRATPQVVPVDELRPIVKAQHVDDVARCWPRIAAGRRRNSCRPRAILIPAVRTLTRRPAQRRPPPGRCPPATELFPAVKGPSGALGHRDAAEGTVWVKSQRLRPRRGSPGQEVGGRAAPSRRRGAPSRPPLAMTTSVPPRVAMSALALILVTMPPIRPDWLPPARS